MICRILIIITLFVCNFAYGQKLIMTDELKSAYRDISSLKINQGLSKLTTLKLKDPQNAMTYYIENYADFYTLFIQEDEIKYKTLIKNRDYRLQKIQNSDPNSPYFLFC